MKSFSPEIYLKKIPDIDGEDEMAVMSSSQAKEERELCRLPTAPSTLSEFMRTLMQESAHQSGASSCTVHTDKAYSHCKPPPSGATAPDQRTRLFRSVSCTYVKPNGALRWETSASPTTSSDVEENISRPYPPQDPSSTISTIEKALFELEADTKPLCHQSRYLRPKLRRRASADIIPMPPVRSSSSIENMDRKQPSSPNGIGSPVLPKRRQSNDYNGLELASTSAAAAAAVSLVEDFESTNDSSERDDSEATRKQGYSSHLADQYTTTSVLSSDAIISAASSSSSSAPTRPRRRPSYDTEDLAALLSTAMTAPFQPTDVTASATSSLLPPNLPTRFEETKEDPWMPSSESDGDDNSEETGDKRSRRRGRSPRFSSSRRIRKGFTSRAA